MTSRAVIMSLVWQLGLGSECCSVQQGDKIKNSKLSHRALSCSAPLPLILFLGSSAVNHLHLFIFAAFIHTSSSHTKPLLAAPAPLHSNSATFIGSWQGAWGLWRAQLSSGFSYCCYSLAYSKNNTLLQPQPLDRDITPKPNRKRPWINHNKLER